ncbi:MAG: argininosuccinate lyase, partial [Ferruginibacter sp.]|nr:argininosuccinate lyase [Ferruginibacter sp.]
ATTLSENIEKFTVGNDKIFDIQIAKHDVIGSIAHAKMLHSIGILNDVEIAEIENALQQILKTIEDGKFIIEEHVEDVHSQIEMMLTEMIGDAGKKIHTGRSRNDQVATDIKLFLRDEIIEIKNSAKQLFDLLISLSNEHKDLLMPGYTHFQIAMPSSFGLWFASFGESIVDDLTMLHAAYTITNKNPLGSGAGYGSAFELNRTLTTQLLQFETLNYNSIYAQTTRGKTEKIVAMAMSSIAATLNKLCADICLYVNQNHAFISFPDAVTTGSSIMPHKKNPDVFELIRSKTNIIQSTPNTLAMMLTNMPTGYHRDVQLTKEVLFPQISSLKNCINILLIVLPQIKVNPAILKDSTYTYLFSVEAVNDLVKKGIPFRDAYKQVGNDINNNSFSFDATRALKHTHEGSLGNLCNDKIVDMMNKVFSSFPS